MDTELINLPQHELIYRSGLEISTIAKNNYKEAQLRIIYIISKIFEVASIKMNPIQLQILSETLISDYPSLKLSDISLIFKKGVAGFFGKLSWGEFHFSEITSKGGWISQYESWKSDQKQRKRREEEIEYNRPHELIMKEIERNGLIQKKSKIAKKSRTKEESESVMKHREALRKFKNGELNQ